jgi:TonB-dependent receptor
VGSDVDYTGDSGIDAVYAMVELPLHHRLTAIVGARFERTEINIDPEGQFGCEIDNVQIDSCVRIINQRPSGAREIVDEESSKAGTDLEDETVLPSINFIYEVIPDMKLRASWSRTLARPTFRELAPVITEEFILGDEFIGNPDLALSKIDNYDLRWEWFRRPGEILAASVFHKEIESPIEMITFGASGRSFTQPVNFERGEVRGAEVEARTSLDVFSRRMTGFTAGVNFTLIDSKVDVPPDEIDSLDDFGLDEDTRRLQGQPEFAVNFNVTWDYDRTGTSASVFYNAVGETLQSGAARGTDNASPNVFERPFGTLNVNIEQKVGPRGGLSFKAKNILQDKDKTIYRTPDDLEAIKTEHDTAAIYSLTYKWSW